MTTNVNVKTLLKLCNIIGANRIYKSYESSIQQEVETEHEDQHLDE